MMIGTAGVWRISAVNEAGGWKDRTTVEDMDLAVRASLKGWKFVYLGDLQVLSVYFLINHLSYLHCLKEEICNWALRCKDWPSMKLIHGHQMGEYLVAICRCSPFLLQFLPLR